MPTIRRESDKRRRERNERRAIVDAAIALYGPCVLADVRFPCRFADDRPDGHELVRRGRVPGAHLVPDLVRPLCRAHHDHVTLHERDGELWGVCFPSWIWDRHPDRLVAWSLIATHQARTTRGRNPLRPFWWPHE